MTPDSPMPGQTTNLVNRPVSRQMVNVLFLCDDNSCRSPVAEALLNFAGEGRFWAFSAGFISAKEVDPIAIEIMREAGIPCGGLRIKDWRGFLTPNAPHIDILVCLDTRITPYATARILPGNPITISWPTENPGTVRGSQTDRRSAYGRMLRKLEERVLKLAGEIFPTIRNEPDLTLSCQGRINRTFHIPAPPPLTIQASTQSHKNFIQLQ